MELTPTLTVTSFAVITELVWSGEIHTSTGGADFGFELISSRTGLLLPVRVCDQAGITAASATIRITSFFICVKVCSNLLKNYLLYLSSRIGTFGGHYVQAAHSVREAGDVDILHSFICMV